MNNFICRANQASPQLQLPTAKFKLPRKGLDRDGNIRSHVNKTVVKQIRVRMRVNQVLSNI